METITIKDVARICGVGVSTVSRAMNNHPDINEETKNMIMQVIKENNYIPNNSARNLKRMDSKAIAVLVKGIDNPVFTKMIKIMEEEIQKKKYSLVLHHVDADEDEVEVALELVTEKKLRGIIFLGGYSTHSNEKLQQLKVPFVLSTIAMSQKYENCGYSSVSVDDKKESFRIVDYLCKLGHKKIATITAAQEDESIGKLRLEGYKQALKSNKIKINNELIRMMKSNIELYSMQNGYEVMQELLDSGEKFTAVFAISDSLAIGACKAILEAGKKIPEDISVAGFDGIEMSYFYNPSITTVKQPTEKIAQESIQLLFRTIKKKETHQHIIFDAELVIGQSTQSFV